MRFFTIIIRLKILHFLVTTLVLQVYKGIFRVVMCSVRQSMHIDIGMHIVLFPLPITIFNYNRPTTTNVLQCFYFYKPKMKLNDTP